MIASTPSVHQNTIQKSEQQKLGENIYNTAQGTVLTEYKELLPINKQTNNLTDKWAKCINRLFRKGNLA